MKLKIGDYITRGNPFVNWQLESMGLTRGKSYEVIDIYPRDSENPCEAAIINDWGERKSYSLFAFTKAAASDSQPPSEAGQVARNSVT